MPLNIREGLTTIRIVFEAHHDAYRAHTIDFFCKDQADRLAIETGILLQQRSPIFQDFQDKIMAALGSVGISGACVSFDAFENSEYATQDQKEPMHDDALLPAA